jgi:hypothetical protein
MIKGIDRSVELPSFGAVTFAAADLEAFAMRVGRFVAGKRQYCKCNQK